MSSKSNIQRLPVEIDPFRLVEQGRVLDGRIPISDFPRLKEQLFEGGISKGGEGDASDSIINVHLEFTRTNTRLPVVKGTIGSKLQMTCQRCLKGKEELFETELEVVLVSSDAQADKLQEGFDTWLVEEQQIFLRDFIEDEILLALPLVIAHDECDAARKLIEALPEEEISEEQEEVNPFAALKDLKLN
ncbi:MAG: YceD family protein [Cocleimonas sp.]|nr:YceD family protein [Cocleimonas sp.]